MEKRTRQTEPDSSARDTGRAPLGFHQPALCIVRSIQSSPAQSGSENKILNVLPCVSSTLRSNATEDGPADHKSVPPVPHRLLLLKINQSALPAPFHTKEKMKAICRTTRLLLGLLAIPITAHAQFVFTTNSGSISITFYTNSFDNEATVVIPDTINGWPVVNIGPNACSYKSMTNITIGRNVTNIAPYAFWSCLNLHNVTIPKNVVSIGGSAFCADGGGDLSIFFEGDPPANSYANGSGLCATIYYLPGTTGWEQYLATNNYSGVLWNPQPQTTDGRFGVIGNQFGFNITGTTNIPIVVEACTNLGGGWVPLQSLNLTNGSVYFHDSLWTDTPGRFYRIRSP